MYKRQTGTSAITRVLLGRAAVASVAGCAAVGLALGAAPASAQAGPDITESVEEKLFDAFMRELALELNSNEHIKELLQMLSDEGGGGRFTGEDARGSRNRDDAGSRSWIYDAPMTGTEFTEVMVDFEELPTGWELDPQLLEVMYAGAHPEESDDLRITSEGLAVAGPGNDGSITKSFTLDGLGVSQSCRDAVQAFDSIDEDVDHMAVLPLAVEDSHAYMFLASTPEAQDLFTGYYDAIVQECGTSIGEKPLLHVGIEPYESLDGFAVNFTTVGGSEEVHMGGASFGHNHVFFVGEGEMDSADVQEVLGAQVDALDEAVN